MMVLFCGTLLITECAERIGGIASGLREFQGVVGLIRFRRLRNHFFDMLFHRVLAPNKVSAFVDHPTVRQHRPLKLLCDKVCVSQPLALDRADKALQPRQGVVPDVALVEPERELIDVAAKVFRAGMVIDPARNATGVKRIIPIALWGS
jgi:hypothetical protein